MELVADGSVLELARCARVPKQYARSIQASDGRTDGTVVRLAAATGAEVLVPGILGLFSLQAKNIPWMRVLAWWYTKSTLIAKIAVFADHETPRVFV